MRAPSRQKLSEKPEDRERRQKVDEALDVALEDTFPASDPPAMVIAGPLEDEEET